MGNALTGSFGATIATVDAQALIAKATDAELAELDRLLAIPATFRAFVDQASQHTFEWYRAQTVVADALDAVSRDELRRLMVFMPPQEGKSELISRLFPAYYLTCHPDRWVGVGSYAFELAKGFSRAARRHYREVTSDLSSEAGAVEQWETPRGGGLWAVGRGGSATGRPAHLLVIDDPLKDRQEADSETIRSSLHDWYTSVLMMRLQPRNAVVIVHTRWHEDDLSGHLLEIERTTTEPERWHVIEVPGIAEAASDRPSYPPTVTVTPDWRQPGEPLQGRYDASRYRTIYAMSPREYDAQVQQRPAAAKGTIFRRDWWKWYAQEPGQFDRTLVSVDCAFKDTDGSDFVAIHVYGRLGTDVYLRHRVHDRLSFTATVQACRDVMQDYPNALLYVEDKANGSAVIDTLRKDLHGVVAVNPEGGKVARAYACQGDVQLGRVWLPASEKDGEFVREAASFPAAPHDDDVDAFTQAMAAFRWELNAAIAKTVPPGKQPHRAERLTVEEGKLVKTPPPPKTFSEWADWAAAKHHERLPTRERERLPRRTYR